MALHVSIFPTVGNSYFRYVWIEKPQEEDEKNSEQLTEPISRRTPEGLGLEDPTESLFLVYYMW